MKGNRVLIADDDPVVRRLLRVHLLARGYQVVCVENGITACAELQVGSFDSCILDWNMPGLSGIEVCQWARAQQFQPRPKIIFLTSRTTAEDQQAGYDAGADRYMTKPFLPHDVSAEIAADN